MDYASTAWLSTRSSHRPHRVRPVPGRSLDLSRDAVEARLGAFCFTAARQRSRNLEPGSPLNPEFDLLLSGTFPAGNIATILRPDVSWQTHRKIWDPIWLAIHEAIAIPLWLLIGALVDAGRSRLGKWMRIYLYARFLFAALGVTLGGAPLWSSLQALFWLTLSCYGSVRGTVWLWARWSITSHRAN